MSIATPIRRQAGITLVEIAIVLLIVGLLIGVLLMLLIAYLMASQPRAIAQALENLLHL